MAYSKALKARLVERMLRNGESANSLVYEAGIPETTLRRWRTEARMLASMPGPDPEEHARSTREWSIEEKLRVISAASSLTGVELGEFLRREGLHSSQLAAWRTQVESALDSEAAPRKRNSRDSKRIQNLEREIRRKDSALAEVTALLTLAKKARLLLGDEDDGTHTSSED
jgi:transposase-like protein